MKFEIFDQRHLKLYQREWCEQQLPVPFPPTHRYMRCKYSATFKVDGVNYCTRHAGIRALKQLTTEENLDGIGD